MPVSIRNLDWLRSLKGGPLPEGAGARFHEIITDLAKGMNVMEQQANLNMNGTPAPPPAPDALHIAAHPQGVQFAITHTADFYQGLHYEIDAKEGTVTHTYDVGSSRNGVLPVGNLSANYQVRTRYPNGASSSSVSFPDRVTGGSGSASLLPSQGAGTTRPGQPPGFGASYRGSKPPARAT
jgi:hypothetical protein